MFNKVAEYHRNPWPSIDRNMYSSDKTETERFHLDPSTGNFGVHIPR